MAYPDISLLGATYSGVSGVTLPKNGGGTATFPWVEGSDTKTANGTYDVTTLAQIIVNVAGGGGSGLVYETGTYKPSADIARPTISFSNAHTDRPIIVFIVDTDGTQKTANSILLWHVVSWYDWLGTTIFKDSSNTVYARLDYLYKNSSGISTGGFDVTKLGSGTTTAYMSYLVSNTAFYPSFNNSRYYRAGSTYKWLAAWKP